MTKWLREVERAVASVDGVASVAFGSSGRRHLCVRVEGAGGARGVVFVSRTPSCVRTLRNVRRDVRRALRA